MIKPFSILPFFTLLALLLSLNSCFSEKHYNESADAEADIAQALVNAKIQNQPVVVIFGANWCPECRALSAEIQAGKNAGKIANEFKVVKVDVGNFERNLDIAQTYGNPISGGIPGATLLSSNNKMIYVTKPGELTTASNKGPDGVYDFLKSVSNNNIH